MRESTPSFGNFMKPFSVYCYHPLLPHAWRSKCACVSGPNKTNVCTEQTVSFLAFPTGKPFSICSAVTVQERYFLLFLALQCLHRQYLSMTMYNLNLLVCVLSESHFQVCCSCCMLQRYFVSVLVSYTWPCRGRGIWNCECHVLQLFSLLQPSRK